MDRNTLLSFTVIPLLLALTPALRADVTPSTLFSDGAVLQRGMRVPVWGTADNGESVTVEFAGQKVSTAAADGKWRIDLAPLAANAVGATMTITGKNTVAVNNVLVGEVWVCSGQSNMQKALDKSIDNGQQEIADANYPSIREFMVPRASTPKPVTDPKGAWIVCSPQTVPKYTAVGYFFARDLYQKLNVPIGIIHSSWGGTAAECWVSHDALAADPELSGFVKKPPTGTKPSSTSLYNAMIAPLQPYAIRGVAWYQGESNSGRGKQYRELFPALITDWRKAWGEGDFPFLYVQIAPFDKPSKIENDPAVREAQLLTLKKVPNTAMVVTADVGNPTNIHPSHKQPVGARLALAARVLAYGEKIEYSGPLYESVKFDGSKAVIDFTHVGGGLVAKDGDLKGFTIAGADKNFLPAKAEIHGAEIMVSSDQVAQPVAVRYGWAKAPDVNLFNTDGLPASPFRTDTEATDTIPLISPTLQPATTNSPSAQPPEAAPSDPNATQ